MFTGLTRSVRPFRGVKSKKKLYTGSPPGSLTPPPPGSCYTSPRLPAQGGRRLAGPQAVGQAVEEAAAVAGHLEDPALHHGPAPGPGGVAGA